MSSSAHTKTSAAPMPVDRPTAAPTPPGPRVRHALARMFCALLMAVGGLTAVGAASPANAASTGTTHVCFKHTNGAAYTYDVYAQRWTGSSWVNAGSARRLNGCFTWTVASGYYWRFQAFTRVGTTYWQGTSGYAYVPAGANLNYGTYWVYFPAQTASG